jgi:hypothetical protein
MGERYVATQTSIYTDPELRSWRPLSIYFYRYLYENDHVHGVTGIGQIAADIIRFETKLQPKQIEHAKVEIAGKVVWFDANTYWVVGRAKHTCYTKGGILHPKFAASARNCLLSQPPEVVEAFSKRYPEIGKGIIGNGSPIHRQSKLESNAVAVAVANAVAVAGTSTKNPPPTTPQESGSPIPLPKRVGGFLSRSGNERQRDDFNAFLQETLAITDGQTVQKALKELNLALRDHEPTNLAAYARPIFDRNVKHWQRNRSDEQELKRLAAETQARNDELDRRLAENLKKRLAASGAQGQQPEGQEVNP